MADERDILRANLDQLRRTEPELADLLARTAPAALTWQESRAGGTGGAGGALSAVLEVEGRKLSLASRYDPMAEAAKLVEPIDPSKHAAAVVLGVGLGYHVAKAAELLGTDKSVILIFEPDLAQLRAVLEKIDHTRWLGRPNVIFADSRMDRAALLGRIERYGSIMTQGLVLVTHPPTRQLHGKAVNTFSRMVTELLAYFRTNVATALVNSTRTIRNLTQNIAHYAGGADTNELHNAARGYPAVCVGAGPSLAKNIDLLRDPAVRRNVVVISAQTTLKPLLDRGIRPDYVTALDYHEISKRFYEGLPRLDDDPPVTLVAEPKAHRSILDSFPGPIRITQNKFLDRCLGDLARPIVPIQTGATVAHLSFYLAQHLGCDPIMFIGQDLGFSDGLYYCPGTAIHDVWAPELNAFNTVEMMEWQRIVRHRGNLQRLRDIHDRPIFSDEQMLTYLKQFERDFSRAEQIIIDATEGGMPKEHTTRMTLADALAQYAIRPVPRIAVPEQGLDHRRLGAVAQMLRRKVTEVGELRRLSEATIPLLRQMKEHQRDRVKADRAYRQIEKNKRAVEKLSETFNLINELNTIGSFRRARADRAIQHTSTDKFEQQRQQLDRDIENIEWMVQACDEAATIFNDSLREVQVRISAAAALAAA